MKKKYCFIQCYYAADQNLKSQLTKLITFKECNFLLKTMRDGPNWRQTGYLSNLGIDQDQYQGQIPNFNS